MAKKISIKKLLLSTLAVVTVAVVSIMGTIAYLQDSDSDVNVMTLGNVSIEQIEQERDANGDLQKYTQDKPAYPAVYDKLEWAADGVEVNGTKYKMFSDDMKNVIDKIVTVRNTGKTDAFVRTIVAIEAPDFDPKDLIHINYNKNGVKISDPMTVTYNDIDYVVFTFTYVEALAAGEVSAPSLLQVFLDSSVQVSALPAVCI